MLKSKLEKFLAARLIIFVIILSILDILLIEKRWIVLAGLAAGAALSLLRLSSMVRMVEHLLLQQRESGTSSKPWYIVQLIVTLAVLALSGLYSLWLFAGITASEFVIPFIIMFYGITDSFGITKNRLTTL